MHNIFTKIHSRLPRSPCKKYQKCKSHIPKHIILYIIMSLCIKQYFIIYHNCLKLEITGENQTIDLSIRSLLWNRLANLIPHAVRLIQKRQLLIYEWLSMGEASNKFTWFFEYIRIYSHCEYMRIWKSRFLSNIFDSNIFNSNIFDLNKSNIFDSNRSNRPQFKYIRSNIFA